MSCNPADFFIRVAFILACVIIQQTKNAPGRHGLPVVDYRCCGRLIQDMTFWLTNPVHPRIREINQYAELGSIAKGPADIQGFRADKTAGCLSALYPAEPWPDDPASQKQQDRLPDRRH